MKFCAIYKESCRRTAPVHGVRMLSTELSTGSVSKSGALPSLSVPRYRVYQMKRLERLAVAALAAIACCAGPLQATAAEPLPAAVLVFEEQPDGKCQILSEGGKLVVLRNVHVSQAIRYRLVRMFLDVPQGRVDGEIGPGATPQKLGCNRVNGRRQSWRVERATFVAASDEGTP